MDQKIQNVSKRNFLDYLFYFLCLLPILVLVFLPFFSIHGEGSGLVFALAEICVLYIGLLVLVSWLRAYVYYKKIENSPEYIPIYARYSSLFVLLFCWFLFFSVLAFNNTYTLNNIVFKFSLSSIIIGIPVLVLIFIFYKIFRK